MQNSIQDDIDSKLKIKATIKIPVSWKKKSIRKRLKNFAKWIGKSVRKSLGKS